MTQLREALTLDLDEVQVDTSAEYPIAGVFSFGRGLFARGPISGAATSYKKLTRLHSGQLVMSRLKAFEGAVVVVPPEFDGWYLSPEFPTFSCVASVLDQRYLAFICRWPSFWSMLTKVSRGIGARRERVQATDLLSITIPLPPIDEQRRVADHLDHTEGASYHLQRRLTRSFELGSALTISIASRPDLDDSVRLASGWRREQLGTVMQVATDRVRIDVATAYPNVGIYSFGRGLFENDDGARILCGFGA